MSKQQLLDMAENGMNKSYAKLKVFFGDHYQPLTNSDPEEVQLAAVTQLWYHIKGISKLAEDNGRQGIDPSTESRFQFLDSFVEAHFNDPKKEMEKGVYFSGTELIDLARDICKFTYNFFDELRTTGLSPVDQLQYAQIHHRHREYMEMELRKMGIFDEEFFKNNPEFKDVSRK